MGIPGDPSGTVGAAHVLARPAGSAAVAAPLPARIPDLLIDVGFRGLSDTLLVPPDYPGVKRLVWRLYAGCGEATVRLFSDRLERRRRELTDDLTRTMRGLDRPQGPTDESDAMRARVTQAQADVRRAWAELVAVETTFLRDYEDALLRYAKARFDDRTADIRRWWTNDYAVVTVGDPDIKPDPSGAISPEKLALASTDAALKEGLLRDTVQLAARWVQYQGIVHSTLPALKDLRPTPANIRSAQQYATEMRVRRVRFERLAAEVEGRHPAALLAYRGLARRAKVATGPAGDADGPPPDLVMRQGEPAPARAAEEEVIAGLHRALAGATDALARFEELRVFRSAPLPPGADPGKGGLPPSAAARIGEILGQGWSGHGAVWAQQPLHVQFDADLARAFLPRLPRAPGTGPGTATTPSTAAFLGSLGPDRIRILQRAGVPGSLANRARKEVFGHMESVIKARKARIQNIAAVTAAAGLLLALPTDGASIYVAAAIDLELAAIEAGIDIREFLDRSALGAVAISAQERMYWVAPELATLAGRIAELGLRALGDVVTDGAASHIIDAIAVTAMVSEAAR
jgi:hypothetical protein